MWLPSEWLAECARPPSRSSISNSSAWDPFDDSCSSRSRTSDIAAFHHSQSPILIIFGSQLYSIDTKSTVLYFQPCPSPHELIPFAPIGPASVTDGAISPLAEHAIRHNHIRIALHCPHIFNTRRSHSSYECIHVHPVTVPGHVTVLKHGPTM